MVFPDRRQRVDRYADGRRRRSSLHRSCRTGAASDDDTGNLEGAKHHYRDAHRLYEDRFLSSEASEPCFEARVADFESVYDEVLARLISLYAALGELEVARDYARELERRNASVARERASALFGRSTAAETA